jgi:S-methylmethionine-dependent homocysteine/selenocysteine methylase
MSFTLETDGRLPSGTPLDVAIETVDRATGGGPTYYMINCAHPTHFAHVLDQSGPWDRIRGIRANASKLSHAELDEAEQLDAGNPAGLASGLLALRDKIPHLAVIGGCCGTDLRHIEAICSGLTSDS